MKSFFLIAHFDCKGMCPYCGRTPTLHVIFAIGSARELPHLIDHCEPWRLLFQFSKLEMQMLREEKQILSYLYMFVKTHIYPNLGSIVKTIGRTSVIISKDWEPLLWPLITLHPNPNYEELDDNLHGSWLLTKTRTILIRSNCEKLFANL